ncbi:MAG TPA: AMP-binding protein [Hyphomicrobiaceae bacterium]|nr:AMP-binding protein [Hyphomicrobiaceae bacterium]
MANANLYALLEAAFARAGNHPAFVERSGATTSYRDLAGNIERYAGALVAAGVAPGDRVMVQAEKSLSSVYLYLATLKVGAVYNPLNTAYTAAELEYFVSDAEPRLFVAPSSVIGRVRATDAGKAIPVAETLEADGTGSIVDRAKAATPSKATVDRQKTDLAALLYTSGTTGRSKGAMITHENLSSNAITLTEYWGFDGKDVLLHALPIFHVHGLFVALHTALLNGATMLWHPKFDLDAVLADLPKATVMMGVPTFYTRLLGTPKFTRDSVPKMRLVISGSAPLLAETHVEFEQRTGLKILERYGMTEAGMITSNPYHGGERLAGTVGYALPGISVRVRSPEGAELPDGEPGVLEVKGPNIFSGYWRNPEKTREDFRSDGYFITGDVATMSPDGRVTIVGRAKDLIISGGFNVYPKEIETEINLLPGVEESAVIGCPHPDFGEGVVAVVTAKAGEQAPTEAAIVAALSGRLAKFKLPKRVFVVGTLPRNAMGKVQKAELRKQYDTVFKS